MEQDLDPHLRRHCLKCDLSFKGSLASASAAGWSFKANSVTGLCPEHASKKASPTPSASTSKKKPLAYGSPPRFGCAFCSARVDATPATARLGGWKIPALGGVGLCPSHTTLPDVARFGASALLRLDGAIHDAPEELRGDLFAAKNEFLAALALNDLAVVRTCIANDLKLAVYTFGEISFRHPAKRARPELLARAEHVDDEILPTRSAAVGVNVLLELGVVRAVTNFLWSARSLVSQARLGSGRPASMAASNSTSNALRE